ncbi:MAG: flagellin [Candidatus Omnitrophota bacterium]
MVVQSSLANLASNTIIAAMRTGQNSVRTSIERLGTGLRINSAKDDPGGLVTSTKLATQFRGLDQAAANAQTGIGIAEVATEGVGKISDLLQQIRSSILAANALSSGSSARLAYQRDIQEKVDEINTIASETKYQNKNLLDGTFSAQTDFSAGSRGFGGSVAFGADASVLTKGKASLNIYQIQVGTETIKSGSDLLFNTGIRYATDISVSFGQLAKGGSAAVTADNLNKLTFNRVSLQNNGQIKFNGLLADGTTNFAGTFDIEASSDLDSLISAIQSKIDIAETVNGVEGTNSGETTVGYNTSTGRLEFANSQTGAISQFAINFTVKNAASSVQTSFGSERIGAFANEFLTTTGSGAKIGNSVSAITGSTFASGNYDIEVSNVQAASNRIVESSMGFFTNVSLSTPVASATNLSSAFINGVSLANGDVITFGGSDPDGTTFSVAFTVSDAAGSEDYRDGRAATFGDLLNGLNNRDRTDTGYGFNQATATLTAGGALRLEDDVANTSSSNFNFYITNIRTVDDGMGGFTIELENSDTFDANTITEGNRETATMSIAGGPSQTVKAGDVVTLEGGNSIGENEPTPYVTFRAGNNLQEGTDKLTITENIYEGTLNDGPKVQFRNGQQNVVFTANPSDGRSAFQQIKINFDDVLNITNSIQEGAERFVLSSTGRDLNFQLGVTDEKILVIPDLRSANLGLDEEQNLEAIDVSTTTGALEALDIVDSALNQTSDVLGRIGSFTSRLQDVVSHLDFTSYILQNSYDQITGVDVAQETTDYTLNSIFMEARASLLIQANTLQKNVFSILYGLNTTTR